MTHISQLEFKVIPLMQILTRAIIPALLFREWRLLSQIILTQQVECILITLMQAIILRV